MELKVFRETVPVCDAGWSTKLELPVETEIMIPDYLPAVFKIVKCLIRPVVVQNEINGGRWQGEGYLKLTVYYQSERQGEELCRAEQKFPFEKKVEMPAGQFVQGAATVCGEAEYLNCRAISDRRLEIRGAFGLVISAQGMRQAELLTALEGGGMEQRTAQVQTDCCLAMHEKVFDVQGNVELPGNGETILDIDGVPQGDGRVQTGHIHWVGTLTAAVGYRLAGSGETACIHSEIAVQQDTEEPQAQENDYCVAWIETLDAALTIQEQDPRQGRLRIRCKLHTELWRKTEYTLLQDAYSTLCQIEEETVAVRVLRQKAKLSQKMQVQVEDTLPENIARIQGGFVTLCQPTIEETSVGQIVVVGKGVVHIICADDRGELFCMDKNFSWTMEDAYPGQTQDYALHGRVQLKRLALSKQGTQLAAELDLGLEGILLCKVGVTAVSQIELGEEYAKEDSTLYIYYVKEGENLYDIAKRYHARRNEIALANGMEMEAGAEALPQGQCLLIPTPV